MRLFWLHGACVTESVLQGGLLLGRAETADVVLGGQGVSRKHAEITRQGPLWILRDLGSTNGTYVDGRRTQHAPLQDGTLIRIGETVGLVSRRPQALHTVELPGGLIAGPELAALLEPLRRAAPTDLPITITGPTGSGKERAAQAVHEWSGRRGPFHAMNCAAIPPHMAEAELFGYRRGAYTGANHAHEGHIRAADGGTLFLDEIGDLPLDIQAKLLRALEHRAVTPLGESRAVRVDIRIICATQQPLEKLVEARIFREDLFARLSGVTCHLPELKQRPAEILSLFRFFLKRETNGNPPDLDARLVEALCLYAWPRNVRELELLTRRLVALNRGCRLLQRNVLPREVVEAVPVESSEHTPTFATREEQDLHRIVLAVRQHGGNIKAAAKHVGMSRQRVYRLLEGKDREALLRDEPPAVTPDHPQDK